MILRDFKEIQIILMEFKGASCLGECHLMEHVIALGMLSYGASCLMGHIFSGHFVLGHIVLGAICLGV